VKHERRMAGALGNVGVGVAELGRPGEIQDVVVEVLRRSGPEISGLERGRHDARARVRLRRGFRARSTGGQKEKKE
jgi:hypothetical protein